MTTTTTTTISSTTTTEACNGKGDPVVCAKSYSYPDDCEDPVKGKDVSESCPILCRSCIEETTTTTTEAQTTNAATTATTTIMLEARDGKKSGGTVAGVLVPLLLIGILVGVWWFHFKGNANAYGRWMDAPPAHLATANDQDGNNVPALSDITLVLNPEDNHGASESSTDDLPAGSMPNAWFVGTMKKDECKAHVAAAKKYEFLVRGSSSVKDGYSVCINMDGAADVRLHLVKRGPNGKFGVPFCSDEFSQIQSFIQHWQTNTLTPKAGETFSLGGAAPHGSSKFIAPAIQLGASTLSATPLAEVMGVDPKIFYVNDKIKAMRDEFEKYGTQEDNNNLAGLIDETYRNPGCDPDDPPGFAFLSAVMLLPQVQQANLGQHHVLALQVYTTSTYKTLNHPLRQQPPQKPNPFAITTFYISEGLSMLRKIKAATETNKVNTYWRGMRDLAISDEFMKNGGAEMACMSTTRSRRVAESFADSKCPLLFKLTSRSFMSHGADISFLSVYPGEKESLYPPFTYLRPVKITEEVVGNRVMIVVEVEPVYPSG